MTGLALALAHARGHLDYEAPVARCWPEFAEGGKGAVTVRQLLGHQAGLPIIDTRLTADIIGDLDRRDAILARQRPLWAPGQKHGYHPTSLGLYQSALMRRSDPKRRAIGAYFAEEIAAPLGLDFWIGLPRDVPGARLASLNFALPREFPKVPPGLMLASCNPWSTWIRAMTNPPMRGPADFTSRDFLLAERPSTIGIGEVRALARAYGEFAGGSPVLGVGKETLDALSAPAQLPSGGGFDQILRLQTRYSLGFLRRGPTFTFGNSDTSYGTPGLGGSFAFADPDLGIGFAYAPNRLGMHLTDDPREKALRDAVYRCLRTTSR
jgi:CubicO group peptidase (beta-lactamase class C family)